MEQVSEGVLRKLGKIKAHMESAKQIGSEKEAQAFAAMLNELLMKHNLEMTDLEWDSEVKNEPVDSFSVGGGIIRREDGKYAYREYPDVEVRSKRQDWSERLARIIADAHMCRMLVEARSSRLFFVGRKSNVAIAEYMYISMYRVIETLSWKEYKTARNKTKWEQIKWFPKEEQSSVRVDYSELEGYRAGWISGFISRLREIFNELNAKRAEEASTGTALMRIDQDKAAIASYMADNTRPAGSLGGSNRGNGRGYADGRAKADQVGITAKGMNSSKPAGQLK